MANSNLKDDFQNIPNVNNKMVKSVFFYYSTIRHKLDELYEELKEGSEFTIREGAKIVGSGKVLEKIEK